ncbi:hypothetical protein OOK58_02100 [Streptomyces sp. NBC_01728]|uniref:hypothetical protein n=1 Tax=unclassified Streptomyces TaxID=2593676 RepID=UPI002255A8A1|nr:MULTISPECIES: hypothetical protein [unclassified Streptomyces]MCX4461481.1 hypothetical protein [Streptomyces sp. NBC_01719]MCX4490388.1 hypothetical protein [Streptomyces sp. NBC_01728]
MGIVNRCLPWEKKLTYKVIQWGAGDNGQALIRAVARHRDLELVGCKVWSPAKDGVDAGVIAGIEPIGVLATTDREELLRMDANVVLFCTRLRPDEMDANDQDIIDLLRSGKNVISVTGQHSMPSAIPGYAEKFEEACREGGSTFTGAGLNPNFIASRLAPTVTGLCADVETLHIRETYSVADDGPEIVFTAVNFGAKLEGWHEGAPLKQQLDHLFVQLTHNVAHSLDMELQKVEMKTELTPAHRDIQIAAGLIAEGTVAAVTLTYEGIPVDPDQIRITVQVRWAVSDDIPGIPITSGWHVKVGGKPNLVMEMRPDPAEDRTFHPETMVGSAIPVIPEVINAEPGLLLPHVYGAYKRRFIGA